AGQADLSVGHLHTLGTQLRGLFSFMAGHEATDRVYDPPPPPLLARWGQSPTDETRQLRVAGILGDVAVRHVLTLAQRPDHVDDALVALAHVATTCAAS